MPQEDESKLIKITALFPIEGQLKNISRHGSGHINKTYISEWETPEGGVQRFVHQCINNLVFTDVEGLMKNISIVLRHINCKAAKDEYKKLELIPAKSGKEFAIDDEGKYWRTFNYLENTRFVEVCANEDEAFEAGRIVGLFQKLLLDLDVKKMNENIRKFTSAPHRIREFNDALSSKPERANGAAKEIEFVKSNSGLTNLIEDKLKSKEIPKRIVHGDTKVNNVLYDATSSKAVCLVDLDTCMPGYSLYDFGDLVRSTSINVAEDEQDFSKIVFNRQYFEAILKGYLLNSLSFLNKMELDNMHIVPQLLAFTLGTRFLTDHLNSDTYFKALHPGHNLERARTQFKIFEVFQAHEREMQELVLENTN